MRKTITIATAVLASALLLAPAASASNHDVKKLAAKECKAQKKADKGAFKALHGKRAMRTCVKGEKLDTRASLRSASQECRDARAEDRGAFQEEHGSNKNGKNALGKCVSSKVKQAGNGGGNTGDDE
jgi:hypothetical protein